MKRIIRKIVFSEEIILYWDRETDKKTNWRYRVTYGDKTAYTEKTHFTISDMAANKRLTVSVGLVDEENRLIKEYGVEQIDLPKEKKRLDITQAPYYAVGDGKTLNTQALQRAFSDCKADEQVYFPKGVYLTGALNVHSDTEIYLEKDAILQGTANVEDYLPKIKSRFEGIEGMCYRSLINMGELDRDGGYNCKNVIIRGKGAILGGGRALMENTIIKEVGYFCEESDLSNRQERVAWRSRGRLININNTQNVVIYGIEAGMGPAWNIHMVYSDNIVTASCYIHSEEVNNGDGWDPDSSTNCTLFDCVFRTRDDMVAIKSGKNPEGNIINRPSKNIRVFDCRSTMGHGIAMGSEMSGGISDVYIWDCDIEISRCGLEIKATKKRGGYIRNVYVNNCKTSIIAIRSVEYNDDGDSANTPPIFENYSFEDISVTGIYTIHTGEQRTCPPIIINGFGNGYNVKNVLFKNIKIKRLEGTSSQAFEICNVENVSFENIFCE